MKLSVSTYVNSEISLPDWQLMAQRQGMALEWGMQFGTDSSREAVKRTLSSHGCRGICSVHLPTVWQLPDVYKVEGLITLVASCGIARVVLHPPLCERSEDAFRSTADTFWQWLGSLPAEVKPTIAVENMPQPHMVPRGFRLANPPRFSDLTYVTEQARSSGVGVCADTCHMGESDFRQDGVDPTVIRSIHLNDGQNDNGCHLVPGRGSLPLESLLRKWNPHLTGTLATFEFDGSGMSRDQLNAALVAAKAFAGKCLPLTRLSEKRS